MAHVTEDKIQGAFPSARSDLVEEFVEVFNKYSDMFGITKEVHENFLLAQIKEEVGSSLESRRENLNYSCKALKKIFKWYKKNPKNARRDGRCDGHRANQRNIGNKAYANRIGNGDIASGDGYRFRGGGFIQLTGRANYQKMSEVISLVLQKPVEAKDVETEISTVTMGLLTAMAFWFNNKLWKCEHIDCVTKKVNRYTDSYDRRKKHYMHIASLGD